ncbi:phosphatidylinositol transfer protein csr1, partial [Coemansia sp. RSA 788]
MDWPFVKTFIKFLEAYYPECLGLCVVYNGPWWFSGVWKLISPLLDPVVASKVQFASKPDALLKFIDPQELLESRGGLDKYAYEYVKPQAEENKLMFDTEGRQAASTALDKVREQFVQATREWTDAKEGGDDDAFARASRERKELSDKYRLAAKEKDKYTRARHFYTRTGVLADGKVDWSKNIPETAAETSAEIVNAETENACAPLLLSSSESSSSESRSSRLSLPDSLSESWLPNSKSSDTLSLSFSLSFLLSFSLSLSATSELSSSDVASDEVSSLDDSAPDSAGASEDAASEVVSLLTELSTAGEVSAVLSTGSLETGVLTAGAVLSG